MEFSDKLPAISRVDQAMSAIRQAILTGDLPPGAPLNASVLAKDLGISIIPLREALQQLAAVGLIELRPSRAARVAELSADDLKDLYHLREILEGDAAERACPLLTPEDLSLLSTNLKAMKESLPTSEEFWRVHHEFHQTLLRPVMTVRLRAALKPIEQGLERYVRLVYDEIGFERHGGPYKVHRPLLQAARAGEPKALRAALVAHYETNSKWMLEGLEKFEAQAVAG
jgi:DNA-binding GntR family transcriptional regulator